MGKCYALIGSENSGQYIAKMPKDNKLTHDAVIEILLETKKFPSELELDFYGKEYNFETFSWHDYMYNEFAFFIVSEKLMNFIKKKNDEK